jgi:hypothetical protein
MEWNDSYEVKLFYDKTIPNPDYKDDHWSCKHVESIDSLHRENMVKRREHCSSCGRQIRIIKHPKTIIAKKKERWVFEFPKKNIDALVIKNPNNGDKYQIMTDKQLNKKWLTFISIKPDEVGIINNSSILEFFTFIRNTFSEQAVVHLLNM